MKFKGTKEKWRSVYDKNTDEYAIYSKNGDFIAVTISATEEDEANALLISKAYEMLEMLEKFSMLNEDHYKDISGFILKTRQLIKEATEI